MEEEIKKKLDTTIELLGSAFIAIDYSLEEFIKLAQTLPKENQVKIRDSIMLLLDHLESSCRDVRASIVPIEDRSRSYRV